ncbi:ATP-binding cassette domain-containing protein [Leucobacter albus]|uniref:ATP-binding cassette domain-containing protein n=1 Tax=Leucobacter albus TaxID=272210 RepID=A0ABW3TPB4_9MICO
MITCERLTIGRASGPGAPVLRGVSARIEHGRVRAVVGGAGAGKTVLATALRGALGEGLLCRAGSVRVGEFNPLGASAAPHEAARHVAWLGHDCESRLFQEPTVRAALAAALEAEFPGAPADDLTLCAALARLGVNDARVLGEDPLTLPASLRRRVALAQALVRPSGAPAPQLVVLDEPFDGLERSVATEVISALQGMRRALRSTVIVLTRDLELAQRFADEISVLEGGQLIETFSPERSFGQPRPSLRRAARAESRAQLHRQTRRDPAAQHRQRTGGAERLPAALELRDFSVLLPDGGQATPPISVAVEPGGALAITGPSGSGKSMLARALVGGLPPRSALRITGGLFVRGVQQAPRAAARTPEQRRAIQLVSYGAERSSSETHTVRTQLRRAIRRARPHATSSAVGARVTELLGLVELSTGLLLMRLCELSPEQSRRLALARALAHDPGVLVWEGLGGEPGAEGPLTLFERVRSEAGVATLLVTSDAGLAREHCGRELYLDPHAGLELRDSDALAERCAA